MLQIILLLLIVFLLFVLSSVWPPNSPWTPWWRTNRKTAKAICDLAKITRSDLVYDLGCGDGTLLITAAKEFGAKGVGVEIDPLRFLISTLMIRIIGVSGKVTVRRKNFFDEDISKATVVVVYLVPKTLEKLLPKFKKELKKGTRVVSYKYPLMIKDKGLKINGEDKQNNLFLYKI